MDQQSGLSHGVAQERSETGFKKIKFWIKLWAWHCFARSLGSSSTILVEIVPKDLRTSTYLGPCKVKADTEIASKFPYLQNTRHRKHNMCHTPCSRMPFECVSRQLPQFHTVPNRKKFHKPKAISSILIHSHPFSSFQILIHAHPFSSILIHSHSPYCHFVWDLASDLYRIPKCTYVWQI